MRSFLLRRIVQLSCCCILQLVGVVTLVQSFVLQHNNHASIITQPHQYQQTKRLVNRNSQQSSLSSKLYSLKPAAIPLMDSGKALARSGELLIDLTSSLDLYGGGLSAAGANIRNCGDCLAQAGASCRMKTATELVIDELREGSDCLREGTDKLLRAVEEGKVDGNTPLVDKITKMIVPMKQASLWLEEAGAAILQKESLDVIAGHFISTGEALLLLSMTVEVLDESSNDGKVSAQRMVYASEQMILAGNELKGEKKEKPRGKSWIKG